MLNSKGHILLAFRILVLHGMCDNMNGTFQTQNNVLLRTPT
jgi:hypothetical protein